MLDCPSHDHARDTICSTLNSGDALFSLKKLLFIVFGMEVIDGNDLPEYVGSLVVTTLVISTGARAR